jgi:hypothetical protein
MRQSSETVTVHVRTAWLKAMLPAKVEVVAKELDISSSVPPQEALVVREAFS